MAIPGDGPDVTLDPDAWRFEPSPPSPFSRRSHSPSARRARVVSAARRSKPLGASLPRYEGLQTAVRLRTNTEGGALAL